MRQQFRNLLKDTERQLEIKVVEPMTMEERLCVVTAELARQQQLLMAAHPKLREAMRG